MSMVRRTDAGQSVHNLTWGFQHAISLNRVKNEVIYLVVQQCHASTHTTFTEYVLEYRPRRCTSSQRLHKFGVGYSVNTLPRVLSPALTSAC
mmetsp:Transcript_3917/g.9865  ORF Transcript_3917/g.9865 Transcript_3917/m.9865 type:complete len:92 (-) Transcript_3917:68-343(-)